MSGGAFIYDYEQATPKIAGSAFVAPGAMILGDVEIAEETGIWYGCILRGDVNEIRIGPRTNIQDGTVVHVATHGQGAYIGADVSIGHMALIHACTIRDGAFIGMKACVMDGALVEEGAMVAAGALVTPGKVVGAGEVWAGSPAKKFRDVSADDRRLMDWTGPHYVRLGQKHKRLHEAG